MQLVQHFPGLFGQVDQVAALHRLHDQHGLAVPAADFIALAALHGGVVVVHIVELDLHYLDLRVVGQDLLQYLGMIVEGDAHMLDFALGLQRKSGLIGPAFFEMLVKHCTLGVHQVEIKIVHTAGFQLALEKGTDVSLSFEESAGQLVGQDVAVAGVAAGQAGLQRRLAPALKVAVGRVEVVEALLQKIIDHPAGLSQIDLTILQGQAHTAKTEVFLDVFHVQYSSRVQGRSALHNPDTTKKDIRSVRMSFWLGMRESNSHK